MELFRLTTETFETMPLFQKVTAWGEGVEHRRPGGKIGTEQVHHAFPSALSAAFFGPVMMKDDKHTVLWKCDGDVCSEDSVTGGQVKVGCTRLKTLERIPLPVFDRQARIRAATLAVEKNLNASKMDAWRECVKMCAEGKGGSHRDMEKTLWDSLGHPNSSAIPLAPLAVLKMLDMARTPDRMLAHTASKAEWMFARAASKAVILAVMDSGKTLRLDSVLSGALEESARL